MPKKIFISYSHADEALLDELKLHLSTLQREGLLDTWTDRRILPGDEWEAEIDQQLEGAHIVLLLVSADFVASKYCYEIEMERALERNEAGEARVIPVILRPCDWRSAPFGKLVALPKDGKAITKWENRDDAWLDVVQGLRTVITEAQVTGGDSPGSASPPATPHNLPFGSLGSLFKGRGEELAEIGEGKKAVAITAASVAWARRAWRWSLPGAISSATTPPSS